MERRIEKAVVLGAGTMGSRIAAHFANAGLPCVLLDIVPPNLPPDAPPAERNKIVRAGLEAAKKSKPAAFFTASLADKIAIGNFEDDLARGCGDTQRILRSQARQGRGHCERYTKFHRQPHRNVFHAQRLAPDGNAWNDG